MLLLHAPLANRWISSDESLKGRFLGDRCRRPTSSLASVHPPYKPTNTPWQGTVPLHSPSNGENPTLPATEEDAALRLLAYGTGRAIFGKDEHVKAHDRTIEHIDGLDATCTHLKLMEEPQGKQRQDAEQVDRAFFEKFHTNTRRTMLRLAA